MAAEDDGVDADRDGWRPREDAVQALSTALERACEGEVRFDDYARVLYATDGSIYGAEPVGVVCPRHAEDVQAALAVAADRGVPVLPRGAGSSLAGQAVGPGCLVLDLSRHMDEIVAVDPDERTATVQPGVVQDDLDDHLAERDLKFAPDPASANRATIGGGIGNNSTGAHSVRYGITDAYVEELQVVLADGSLIRTRDVVLDSPEWDRIVGKDDREAAIYRTVRSLVEDNAAEIEDRYPRLKRCVSGYNLHKVIREESDAASAASKDRTGDAREAESDAASAASKDRTGDAREAESDAASAESKDRAGDTPEDGDRIINLSKVFVGAEGTLGVVVEATLSLVTRPEATALVVACYDDLLAALAAVPEALALDPSAVELMDSEVFRLAAESPEYAEYVEPIPAGTAAALMVEFDSELWGRGELDAPVAAATERLVGDGAAFDAVEAFAPDAQARLWKLRKAAIPLLMSMEGDPKPYPFVEDASVPPDELAEYVAGFREILAAHDTTAAYFAHAGVGTLHIRPVLNLKAEDGVATMRSIAADVTDLALAHDGAFSGEHGDGLARTEFNPKLYGPALWDAFKAVKSAFDPDWRMNPGKVVFRDDGSGGERGDGSGGDGTPTDMREHLRYGPDYYSLEPATTLDFEDDGGFGHLVERCNGCGTCRQTGNDVMCPTYRATGEEIATTRGRANLLRAAISGDLDPGELYDERFQTEVLGLCVGCKGCQRDCPTGVDLAKLKAEVSHQYHDRAGLSVRERLFSNVDRLAAIGSAFAPLPNWGRRLPGTRWLLDRTVGIAPDRTLPAFRRESLVSWFAAREDAAPETPTDRVILFPDTYTNYATPEVGTAAVAVLEAAGVRVSIPDIGPTGRAAYSQGRLDLAADRATALLDALAPRVARGWSVVFVEPSDVSMVVDEYASLVSDPRRERLAANAYGVCEYLDQHRLDEAIAFDAPETSLAFHGHCHQTARAADHHAVGVLRRAGYAVDPLDSSCCGMAGSFGYEAEHYDLSRAIGRLLLEHVDGSDADRLVASGTSCRSQVADFAGYDRPRHPIEALADALE